MKTIKKVLSIILSLAMLFPLFVYANSYKSDGIFTFKDDFENTHDGSHINCAENLFYTFSDKWSICAKEAGYSFTVVKDLKNPQNQVMKIASSGETAGSPDVKKTGNYSEGETVFEYKIRANPNEPLKPYSSLRNYVDGKGISAPLINMDSGKIYAGLNNVEVGTYNALSFTKVTIIYNSTTSRISVSINGSKIPAAQDISIFPDDKPRFSLENSMLQIGCTFVKDKEQAIYVDDVKIGKVNYMANTEAPEFLPPAEHPRLFLNKSIIPTIKNNFQYPEMKKEYDIVKESAQTEFDGILPKEKKLGGGNYIPNQRSIIEHKAFLYVFENDKEMGQKAVDSMANFLKTIKFNHGSSDITRSLGEVITGASIVYDWCYDLMSEENKMLFISTIENLAAEMELGYPNVTNASYITGHNSEAQIFRDLLSASVAVYDEYPDMYNLIGSKILKDFVPSRDYLYKSGMHYQGDSYGAYRFQWDLYALMIYDRMGYPNLFSDDIAKVPYSFLYNKRPDGPGLKDGDSTHSSEYYNSYWCEPFIYMVTASYYKDPYLKDEFLRQNNIRNSQLASVSPLWILLLNDPTVEAKPIEELPNTRYFKAPMGEMIARTGWEKGVNSNDVVAKMRVGAMQTNNHQHYDAGNFQLYYKGNLALDSGVYGSYNSDHHFKYAKNTIAHNCMLIYDPKEVLGPTKAVNTGGQRFVNNSSEPTSLSDIQSKEHITGEILGADYGPNPSTPEYSYLKGDITKAYSSKVEKYNRSFVFLDLKNDEVPASLIVYDNITSANKDFKKTWLMHSQEEPNILENETTLKETQNGHNGKLINETLLPKNADILKIGGENQEFMINGVNYPETITENSLYSTEAGKWRVEISPKSPSKTDSFLNVMQVSDADKNNKLETEYIENANTMGVKIADRVVLFAKESKQLINEVTFEIKGDKPYKILITDLSEGNWTLEDSKTQKQFDVAKETGTIYFEGMPGTYKLIQNNSNDISEKTYDTVVKENVSYNPIQIMYDRQFIYFDTKPQIINDITMVPMRKLFQEFNADVAWNEEQQEITAKRGGTTIKLTINSDMATVNDLLVKLDLPPQIINGETLVPLRFISETFKAKVSYYEANQMIHISKLPDLTQKPEDMQIAQVDDGRYQIVDFDASTDKYTVLKSLDNNLGTYSAQQGMGEWSIYDLGETKSVATLSIAWYNGNIRSSAFEVYVSNDKENWEMALFGGRSKGDSNDFEHYKFTETKNCRYIKIVGYGNDGGSSAAWNSMAEVAIRP